MIDFIKINTEVIQGTNWRSKLKIVLRGAHSCNLFLLFYGVSPLKKKVALTAGYCFFLLAIER